MSKSFIYIEVYTLHSYTHTRENKMRRAGDAERYTNYTHTLIHTHQGGTR